jgi:plastocyanin
MHFTKSIAAASACVSAAYAATHQIQVGTGGLRVFQPPTVTANVGDTVQFVFVAGVC